MKENVLPRHKQDTVVVGGGVLGLMMAKKLTDLGQEVTLLEASPQVAPGPSIKNHGWLHRGSIHSVSVPDREKAQHVVQKIMYGHDFIRRYAPEAVENPFQPVYAVTQDHALAARAVATWDQLGVPYQEISQTQFFRDEPGINPDFARHIFATSDLVINNRVLYQRLLTDHRQRGGKVITDAEYTYEGDQTIEVTTGDQKHIIDADSFVYCTGPNLGFSYEKLTGEKLDMNFWKSHLILLPRFSNNSVVTLDRNEAITINHGNTAVTNRSYDEVLTTHGNTAVSHDEVELSFDALQRMYPQVKDLKTAVQGIACIKPDINAGGEGRHSVDSHVLEPKPGHVFALAGKMTESPYVADSILRRLYLPTMFPDISSRPVDIFSAPKK